MGKIIIWLFFDGGSSRRWEVEITGEHSSVQWKILNLYSECETAKWRVEVQASHFSDTKFRFAWASSPNSIVQSFCRASWSCAKHNCRSCDWIVLRTFAEYQKLSLHHRHSSRWFCESMCWWCGCDARCKWSFRLCCATRILNLHLPFRKLVGRLERSCHVDWFSAKARRAHWSTNSSPSQRTEPADEGTEVENIINSIERISRMFYSRHSSIPNASKRDLLSQRCGHWQSPKCHRASCEWQLHLSCNEHISIPFLP